MDPRLEGIETEGAFAARFVNKGYGAAWDFQSADLNGDGAAELLYGGQSVVAVGADEKPIWTFDLPADTGNRRDDAARDGKRDKGSGALRFFGVHVRDIQTAEGVVFVLDSADRVHLLDAKTGELKHTRELGSKGNACSLALFDANDDGVVDAFPSGGNTAYSGRDGAPIWHADINFTPSIVVHSDLDVGRGRELVLIQGASNARGELCPSERSAIEAMHDGIDGALDPAPDARSAGNNVAAYGPGGKLLFEANVDGVITTTLLADLDGNGKQELLLATTEGITPVDDEGNLLDSIAVEGTIDQLFALDAKGRGDAAFVVSAHTNEGSTVSGYSMGGEALWSAPLGARAYTVEAIDLDGDGAKELITGLGYAGDAPGVAPNVAWKIGSKGPEELWRAAGRAPARGYAIVGGDAEPRLYIAGGDAVVTGIAPSNGEVVGTWAAGSMNHDLATGDLDGDGKDEAITGDVFGNLVVTDANGERMFAAALDGGPAAITGIAIAPPDGDNPGYFVVSGYAWQSRDAGILAAYDAHGKKLFATTTPNGLARVKLADLDGDGAREVVVADFTFRVDAALEEDDRAPKQDERESARNAESDAAEPCGVMAYDRDGNALWSADVASCDIAQIAVGDIDGNGTDEIAYADLGRAGPHHVALIDGAGVITWQITSETDDAVWLEILDDGVAYGGRSDQMGGHVTMLAAEDGSERWRTDLEGGDATELPGMEPSPFGALAGSLFGQKLADINGDDAMDLAFTTAAGEMKVMDGQTGEPLFEAKIDDAQDNLVGGPLAYVAGRRGEPGYLVATGYDFAAFGTHAVAFDLGSGEIVGNARLDELVAGVQGAAWSRGEEGVVIATTFDTYAFDLRNMPTPRPGLGGEVEGDGGSDKGGDNSAK